MIFSKDNFLHKNESRYNLLQDKIDITNLNIENGSDFIGFFENKLFFLNKSNELFKFYFYDITLDTYEEVSIDGSNSFAYIQPIILEDIIYFAHLKSIDEDEKNPFLAEIYSISTTSKEINLIDSFKCSNVIDLNKIGDNLVVLSREILEDTNKSYLFAYDLESNLQKRQLVETEYVVEDNKYTGEQIICFGGTESILVYETGIAYEQELSEGEGDFIVNYYNLYNDTIFKSIKLDNPVDYLTGNLEYLITNVYSPERAVDEGSKVYLYERLDDSYSYDYFNGFRSSNFFLNEHYMHILENAKLLNTDTDVLIYSPVKSEYLKYNILENVKEGYYKSKICYNGNTFAYAIYDNDFNVKEIIKVEVNYNYSNPDYNIDIPEELLSLDFDIQKGIKLTESDVDYNNKHIYCERSNFENRPFDTTDIIYWSLENNQYNEIFETRYYPFIEEIILNDKLYIWFSDGNSKIYEVDIENHAKDIIFETSSDKHEFIDDFKSEQGNLQFTLKTDEYKKSIIYNPISKEIIENDN